MNAAQKITEMLKEVYEDGEVNAAEIWKGYDAATGRTGWHYVGFGSNAQYMGNSIKEVEEWVEDVKGGREAL